MCRPIESMSDAALLSTLVGPRTAANLLKDASGSLSRLLNADVAQQVPSSSVGAKLMAARELVRRALAETMRERDMLASPAAVRDYLVKGGVDAARMVSKGYGPTKPIADNATKAGREKNRRTDFFLAKPGVPSTCVSVPKGKAGADAGGDEKPKKKKKGKKRR